MKYIFIALPLLAVCLVAASAEAGIFGHRRAQPAGGYYYSQQPTTYVLPQAAPAQSAPPTVQQPARYVQQPPTAYRSYSQQPRSNPFPFDSRADPRDWKEAHRGYGVKIRGW